MQVFLSSMSGVLIILVMVSLGYLLTKRGWFDEQASALMTKLVTRLALPCYLVYTIVKRFTAAELLALIPQLRFPALSMVILLGIATACARCFAIDKSRQGLFISMFFNSNTVFVGMPINQALFGEKSIPYVLVYYMCNTIFFWTLGAYLIQKDDDTTAVLDWKMSVKRIFSPPLLGFLCGLLLVMFSIQLPYFLLSDLQYIGNLTIPLSMLFIGISVARVGLSRINLSKDAILILLGRFFIAPLLMLMIVYTLDIPILMKQVFVMQSAMPVMTNAPIIAKLYGADSDYASIMVMETTVLTLFVVPILMSLLSFLG